MFVMGNRAALQLHDENVYRYGLRRGFRLKSSF